MSLFEGYLKAYGFYSGSLTPDEVGKMTGKRASVNGTVTVDLWSKHISGEQGLGIIPITENNEVKFAAIDIDQYDLDLPALAKSIHEKKLPLIVCRTKSGGAHVFLLMTKFHEAAPIQRKMREIASILGFGGAEIFPKQTHIVAERGDVGNWINMPYFNASKTNRYAISHLGHPLEITEFTTLAKNSLVDPDYFLQLKVEEAQHLEGGPPCLNHLISMGFPKGTRNNGLLNLGVYAKKAFPDSWQLKVEEYNHRFMDPPLSAGEVLGVIHSLNKKDFFYMCKQTPISQYCNMPKCRGCKHGIGQGSLGMPKFGTLTKLRTDPPIWFLEVEGGGRLELATGDLQNQRAFQNRCMASLNIMPIPPKNEVWQEIVSALLENVHEVEIPPEATPTGMLKAHLEEFCTSRVQAKTIDDLLLGKPWTNGHMTYFRMKDFLEYLDRKKFVMARPYIAMHLRDWGASTRVFNIRGKSCSTYFIKEFKKQDESFPSMEEQKPTPY